MFSWLNFEELLIHNPIELINPSKDTISVAMNKKQYIEFFSNKYIYNGVYYNEEMDFCLFYYADPLQSYKEGDMYAQGYIDVEMKIYRVKWLCNVSIKLPLAPETTGNLLDVKDGAGFSGTGNGQSNMGIGWFHFNEWKKIPQVFKAGDKITISGEIAFFDTELYGDSDATHVRLQTQGGDWRQLFRVDVKNVNGKFYTREALKTSEFTENPSHRIKVSQTMDIDQHFITQNENVNHIYFVFDWIPNGAKISVNDLKIELNGVEKKHTAYSYSSDGADRFSTIYPTTNADRPSYIGQYTDYTLEDSTNPSSYTWREAIGDKWNVSKTEMVVNAKNKTITTVLNGALAKCTKDKNITGWKNLPPNANYKYQQPQYSLDIGADDFIISGFGLRGLKNG